MKKKGKPRGNPEKINPFQWKPGESGNPKGRPRKHPMTDLLEELLAEKIPKELDPRESTFAEALLRNWLVEGIRTKDTQTVVEIFNRIDGKVKDRLELGGENGEPIQIQRVDAKRLTDEELDQYEKIIRKATSPKSDSGSYD